MPSTEEYIWQGTSIGHRIARSDYCSFHDFIEASSLSSRALHPSRKQKNKEACRFCEVKLKDNHKTVKVYNKLYNKIHICSNCENLYRIIKREYEANNKKTIKNITWYIKCNEKSKN